MIANLKLWLHAGKLWKSMVIEMVVEVLPDWWEDKQKKLESFILQLAEELQLPLELVLDSRTIHDSIQSILKTFRTLKEVVE